jgi:AbrB family looped-hinge helix DNA binding protein
MLKSSISSKGQVTVPVEIRDRLGLAAGTAVTFELRPDGVLLKKGALGAHPVDRSSGSSKRRAPRRASPSWTRCADHAPEAVEPAASEDRG